MKRAVKCKSGVTGWQARLQSNYHRSFKTFERYCEMYGLHSRLGFKSARRAWNANPIIQGSVVPDDFCVSDSRVVCGEYNKLGYCVLEGNDEIYSAGNAQGDSYFIVPPTPGRCVSLKELRKFCVRTCKEMAEERGAKFCGVQRVPEGDLESIPG
jgi:hypothetical protein